MNPIVRQRGILEVVSKFLFLGVVIKTRMVVRKNVEYCVAQRKKTYVNAINVLVDRKVCGGNVSTKLLNGNTVQYNLW